MPRTSSPKRDLVVYIRVGPVVAARLTAEAQRLERSVADIASLRLTERYTQEHTDGAPVTMAA